MKNLEKKYGNGSCYLDVEFENVTLEHGIGFVITDPAKQIQTKSPKTGDDDLTLLTAVLALSGITACICKKRKNGLKL